MKSRFGNIKKMLEGHGYVEGNTLTDKGDFAAKIYSDELLTTEIFGNENASTFSEYEIFLTLAVLAYEPRDKDKFFEKLKNHTIMDLKDKLRKIQATKKEKRFRYLFEMASMIDPCFKGGDFFDIVDITTLLEGDILRLFGQILDRLRQIRRASMDDDLAQKLDHIADKIRVFLSDVTLY
jgi:superfamily II RNA helicase